MQILKCPNCGASLKPNQGQCEYCGTYFKLGEPIEEIRLIACGGLGNNTIVEFDSQSLGKADEWVIDKINSA